MNTNHVLRLVIIVGLFAVLFIPFVITDSLLFPFITGKNFVFRVLVELLFGLWLVAIFRDQTIRPKFSWIVGVISVFVVIVTLADVFGANFYQSFWSSFERMDGLITLIHLFLYFLIAGSVINTRERWLAFFNTSVFASVMMAGYVFLQLSGRLVINQGGVRVDGTFGNATYLAVYMLFNFFLTLFLLVRLYQNDYGRKNRFLWSWYLVAIVFQTISIYLTATRGDILGLIAGVLLSALIVAIFGRSEKRLRKISAAVLIFIAVVISGFFLIRDTEFVRNSPTLNRFATLNAEEISKQGRWYVWPMAIKGFKERPILGWGQDNFTYVFNKYYDPRMYDQEPWFDRAHNIVLDWLVAGGILGLASYLAILGVLIWSLYRSPRFSLLEKSVLIGLVFAYFFQNLFVFDNLISYVYFFSILAFIHSEISRDKSSYSWLNKLSESSQLRNYVVPLVAAAVVISAVYCLNVKQILAGREIIRSVVSIDSSVANSVERFKKIFEYETFGDAEAVQQMFINFQRVMRQNADPAVKSEYAELAISMMQKRIDLAPLDARYRFFQGTMLNRVARHQEAIAVLNQARELSPKKQQIIFETGLSYLSLGDYENALKEFRTAYELEPNYADAGVMYAIGALYAKDNSLADEIVSRIPEEKLATDERLLAAYVDTGNFLKAIQAIELRAALRPDDLETRFRLAAGYLLVENRTKSIEILQQVITDFPAARDQAEYYISEIRAGRNP